MIIYFADRQMNILGQASTGLPQGLTVTDDLMTVDVDTGTAIFECKIPFDKKTRALVESCAEVGNYILRSGDGENEFYQIIETETDTKKQEVYIYAEDEGMDLLNEVVGEYEADKAYPISYYVNKYAANSGFIIGINEIPDLTRKLSWDGEATAQERILSVATQFDNSEIAFSFDVDGLYVVKKYINIYKKRGDDTGISLRLNYEIDGITTTKSISNLATALQCTGGTPEGAENPITLNGYTYDDGNFYVEGGILKSREALKRWARLLWKDENGNQKSGGHIVKQFSYDTESREELCNRAITELKKICDMEVNYDADITNFPDNVRVGDRVNIIDDAGELYLSTRILTLEKSVANNSCKAVLGDYLIKSSGIHQKVIELAQQFAKNAQSAARALSTANAAKTTASEAKTQAETAATEAANAQTAANAATAAANTAQQNAEAAQAAADAAQSAVDAVESDVAGLETTVANAQAAADAAAAAAATADTKATEAHTAATNAATAAGNAATAAATAQSTADTAKTNAAAAQSAADSAKTQAEAAATTAAAAKLDAENAQKDIDALGEDLTTLSNTMSADYARKTDLTEATSSLQTQITQNADTIATHATQITTIDETANNAATQAAAAQSAAAAAQSKADTAAADAASAQTAADNAAEAAATAQTEANNAKTAAATAQSVADKAKKDLEAAQADLVTVQGRVDATEEEIAAAQAAVTAAQTAADTAQADATAAANAAAAAQTKADTAATNAATAQTAADNAATAAATAQATADEAKGDASAAQTAANEAAATAAAAQTTANTAKTNAENAQSAAEAAATAAATAQTKADEADAAAAKAAADLATAQENLAAVTSRVDATEDDIAAAQSAVKTAQTAAEKAKADAAAAQSTADTAKTNAANAQTAANNAKAAADAAQEDADAAKAAADAAQDDVDALAVRVTTAETSIKQNSEAIALRATKEEVTQTLGGYYTKAETDAAIEVSAEGITSSVTSKINSLQIGGRNLLRWTQDLRITDTDAGEDGISKYKSGVGTLTETENGIKLNFDASTNAAISVPLAYDGCIENNEYVTLSFDYRGTITNPGAFYFMQRTTPNVSNNLNELATLTANETEWQHYSVTFANANANVRTNYRVLIFYGNSSYQPTDWIEIKKGSLMLEKGNKATAWTPAPEDVSAGISDVSSTAADAQSTANSNAERVTVAESDIQQLADMIATLVTDGSGASLMQQTENGWSFSVGSILDSLSKANADIGALSGEMDGANSSIDTLKKAVNDLGVLADYVIITTYNGQPCIELGEAENQFKLRITNTEIQFADGTIIPAYISNQKLKIEQAEVKDELQFGGFAWKVRSNGNMGLVWKGVDE